MVYSTFHLAEFSRGDPVYLCFSLLVSTLILKIILELYSHGKNSGAVLRQ